MIEEFANGRVRSWASILDDVTREQAARSAQLDIITSPIALMPDAHFGAGATIGSVIVTENAVMPMAVGVDIGCGMAARRLNLKVEDLSDTDPREWVEEMKLTVPAGLGRWHGDPHLEAEAFLEANPVPASYDHDIDKVAAQLGTLGSGNHFVELSVDDLGQVWLLLHSGSRGAGNRLAQIHAKIALQLHEADLPLNEHGKPEKDLAWLDANTSEFDLYLTDLWWAQAYALENRRIILKLAHEAVEDTLERRITVEDEINCHHNYASYEHVKELGAFRYVTRKGAIKAGVGDRGLIPGAMGQASFVVSGLGNPASYESCSHGAGRVMSRKAARRDLADTDWSEMQGVAWQDRDAKQLLDEHPKSYKDVETVMRDQADLVRVDYRLKAIANFKGVEEGRKKR